MNFEEARLAVAVCNGKIKPKQRKNDWYCFNCGVDLKESEKNKSGFRHFYAHKSNTKKCLSCNQNKTLNEYYNRTGYYLDDKDNTCIECCKNNEAAREENLREIGISKRVWFYKDVWNGMLKVKGKQSIRQFVNQAVRKEIEIRARTIMMEQARKNIESKRVNIQ